MNVTGWLSKTEYRVGKEEVATGGLEPPTPAL